MTLLRAQTFGRMTGNADARGNIGAKGVQVYAPGGMLWAKKGIIMRNAPHTIENPHPGQIEWRIMFGDTAKRVAESGFKDSLPATAANIRRELTGKSAVGRIPRDKYASMSYHSLEELKGMHKGKPVGPIVFPPARR